MMTRAARRTTLALAIAAAGCGGSTSNLQDYCKNGAAAICQRLFGCDPQAAAQLFGSESACTSQNSASCTNASCTGGKSFDSSAADQCLSAYHSISCTDLANQNFPAVCSNVCK